MSGHHLDNMLAGFPIPPPKFHGKAFHRYEITSPKHRPNASNVSTKASFSVSVDLEKVEVRLKNSRETLGSALSTPQIEKHDLRTSQCSERPSKSENIIERPSFEDSNTGSSIYEQRQDQLQPKQFVKDSKKLRWRRYLKHVGIFCTLCLAIWFFVPFPLFNGKTQVDIVAFSPKLWSCKTPGFIGGGSWNLIGIDVRFGRMTFGQAKGLEVAWNRVAGHGLQFILAMIAYRVFTDALMRTTEITHVPYGLFTSLALFSTKTDALWDLIQGLFSLSGWRAKFIIGWLFFSTAYISIFPSLMDVISGYEAAYDTVLVLPNKTMLRLDGLDSLQGPLYYKTCRGYTEEPKSCPESHVEFYDPVLNESYSRLWEWHVNHEAGSRPSFYAELPENFNCVAEENRYEWGFSGEWVLIAGCVNSFWLFGLWILWLDAHTQSEFCKKGRRMGVYRAIVDIAEVIREDLGPNLAAYSEAELSAALHQQGRIKYHVSKSKTDSSMHIGLSSRQSDRLRLDWDQTYK